MPVIPTKQIQVDVRELSFCLHISVSSSHCARGLQRSVLIVCF